MSQAKAAQESNAVDTPLKTVIDASEAPVGAITTRPSYKDLASINVNANTEKKNGLTYLTWAWAVDTLLRNDESASWEYLPPVKWGDTVMVFCRLTAFGKTRTAQLPVMDHRNKCIPNPDAFAVNTAMQRCLAKAIGLFGIGLYIYAGEDLPLEVLDETAPAEAPPAPAEQKSVVLDKNGNPVIKQGSEYFIDLVALMEKSFEETNTALDEATAIDWMVAWMADWVSTVPLKDELRGFWTANKEARERIKAFSKPKYDALETTFKMKAKELP